MVQYNGVTYFDNKPIDLDMHIDASLTGLGRQLGPLVYALPLNEKFIDYHITQLEMLNVLVALKVLSEVCKDKKVKISCDNLAVVEFINSGKTRDPFLVNCSRNIWLLTAIFNIQLVMVHIPGKHNVIANLLSRWITINNPQYKLNQLLPQNIWVNTHIRLTVPNFHV